MLPLMEGEGVAVLVLQFVVSAEIVTAASDFKSIGRFKINKKAKTRNR